MVLRRLLATWGSADYGRLGHGSLASQVFPRTVDSLRDVNIVQVAAGGAHTAAVADDGTLYTFGLNDHGQLGHSSHETFTDAPREVLLPEGITAVACGSYHTVALSESGRIWAFGSNKHGQLGLGRRSEQAVPLPALVRDLEGAGIAEVCTGARHTLARTGDGDVYTWGCGDNGKLGHGTESFFKSWHEPNRGPRLVRALQGTKIQRLAAGMTCSGAVDDEGNVYTMGYGRFWQLGLGHDRDQPTPAKVPGLGGIKQLALGGLHAVAVKQNGSMLVWGGDEHGCLGLGRLARAQREPVMAPNKISVAQAACGWKHTAALAPNGSLFCWGWGGSAGDSGSMDGQASSGGQLGLGNEFDSWNPREVHGALIHGDWTDQFDQRGSACFRFVSVSCGFNHTTAVIEAQVSGPCTTRP